MKRESSGWNGTRMQNKICCPLKKNYIKRRKNKKSQRQGEEFNV